MKIKKNSPEVWDLVWKKDPTIDQEIIQIEKNKILFKRFEKILIAKFGSIKGLKTIEIGAGTATYSLLLASMGAKVTVLDYSPRAIKISKKLFKRYGYNANFLEQDALKLNSSYFKRFDVSMSFGTAEHFSGKDRLKIIKTHFDLINNKGMVFIAVPNKWNAPYLIHKKLSQSFKKWNFGEEYPFSPLEFIKIGNKIKRKFYFTGSTIFSDPFCTISRLKKLFNLKWRPFPEHGTFLDKYFARYFVAYTK